MYVYAKLVEQGTCTLSSAEDIDKLMVLKRMNDERFFVCIELMNIHYLNKIYLTPVQPSP